MNKENRSASLGIELNFIYLLEGIIKKWWLIVCLTLAFIIGALGVSKFTYSPTFSSGISFVVNAITEDNTSDTSSYNSINGSIKIANTYTYILSSRILYTQIVKECEKYDVTEELLNKAINVTTEEDTNVIEMRITTDNAQKSKAIADSIMRNYSAVAKSAYPNIGLTVINPPIKAVEPDVDYSTIRNVLIGAFIGFAVSIMICVISALAKTTIREPEEIEENFDITVLGTVGHVERNVKGKPSKADKPLLITESINGFAFVETYKAIRTKIESLSTKNGYKTIMITSASESEGKTTVTCNIAIGLAKNGKSVLLVDADLRKPAVCKFLGVNTGVEQGLADVVNGKTTLNKSIRYVEKYDICILAGTSSVSDPSEVLSSSSVEKIIKMAENEFDYIIIDTAPAAVVTDASVVSNYSDACILVIREDRSSVGSIRNVIDDISNGKAKIIGSIFNNAKGSVVAGIGSKYSYGGKYGRYGKYGYGRGYGYGYGYGYGDNRQSSNIKDDSDGSFDLD